MMVPRKDISGNRYGALVCIAPHNTDIEKRYLYLCLCDCGRQSIVNRSDLVSGKTKSCGCGQGKFTHGLTRCAGKKSKLYCIWVSMRDRCGNQNNKRFGRYGGRGISVCGEWLDYAVFYAWAMSNGYSEGLSIERENNNGNYEPSNCKWIPRNEQSLNTQKAKFIELDGVIHSMRAWSNLTGIPKDTIRSRLRLGWSTRDALTKEVSR